MVLNVEQKFQLDQIRRKLPLMSPDQKDQFILHLAEQNFAQLNSARALVAHYAGFSGITDLS